MGSLCHLPGFSLSLPSLSLSIKLPGLPIPSLPSISLRLPGFSLSLPSLSLSIKLPGIPFPTLPQCPLDLAA